MNPNGFPGNLLIAKPSLIGSIVTASFQRFNAGRASTAA
jgi:hypothetical protein